MASRHTKAAVTANTYNEFKEFEGKRYTGMKVGRRHKWYYDRGEWREKKITPEQWEFTYSVKKRRAGKAPAGSGVPVGFRWTRCLPPKPRHAVAAWQVHEHHSGHRSGRMQECRLRADSATPNPSHPLRSPC